MIIIVEGIDRVGKTTLCNKLQEELNIPVYKNKGIIQYNKMDNTEETDKMLKLIDLCNLTNSSIIFDRFYLSDFVYGILERNYNIDIAIDNFRKVDDLLSEIDNVFLIYVLPTDIENSSKQHGKDLRVHDGEFYDLFRNSKIKNKWQVTYNTLNEAVMFIREIRSKK